MLNKLTFKLISTKLMVGSLVLMELRHSSPCVEGATGKKIMWFMKEQAGAINK